MKRSKRYREIASKIDKNKLYSVAEAIDLIKHTATTKFPGSVEVHVRTGIDVGKGDQQIRGSVTLPHGTGKTKKIAAFVGDDKQPEAKAAGADLVGSQELIDEIKKTGKLDFDVAIATPDMMPKLAVIAKTLGPRGLMPSPKNETITTNLKKTIGELRAGRVNFKNDDTGNVHQIIGSAGFTADQLTENFEMFIQALRTAKPAAAKGDFIKSISLASSMGPGIKVQSS